MILSEMKVKESLKLLVCKILTKIFLDRTDLESEGELN